MHTLLLTTDNTLLVGDNVEILVLGVDGDQVKVGVVSTASPHVQVQAREHGRMRITYPGRRARRYDLPLTETDVVSACRELMLGHRVLVGGVLLRPDTWRGRIWSRDAAGEDHIVARVLDECACRAAICAAATDEGIG